MRQKDFEKEIKKNNYTLNDGLKVFFYAIMLSIVVSIAVTILLSLISVLIDMPYGEFLNTRFVAYIMVISMGVSYLILYFLYNKKNNIKNFATCGLKNKPDAILIILSIIAAVGCVFVFEPITTLILKGLENVGFEVVGDLTYEMNTWWRVTLGIIGYALLPAVAEELVFRGIVQKGFERRCTPFCSIFFSTFCFVIMHGSLQQFVYQIVLGVVLASLYYFTKNILYPFLFHFVNNLTVVIISLVGGPHYMENGFFYISDFMGYFMPILLCVLGVGLIVLLIYYLRIKYKRSQNHEIEVDGDNIIIEEQGQKLGLRTFASNLNLNEKFYFILGMTSAVVIWIFNTFGYF